MHCQIVARSLGFPIDFEAVEQLDEFLLVFVRQQLRRLEQTPQDIQRVTFGLGRFIVAHGRAPLSRARNCAGIEEQERKGFCESRVVGTIG